MHFKHIQEDETYGSFIASDNISGKVAHLNWALSKDDNNVIEIKDLLIVKKENRGQGIGSTLINLLLEHAKNLNVYEVIGETQTNDELAHAFYEKNGFSFPQPHRFTLTVERS